MSYTKFIDQNLDQNLDQNQRRVVAGKILLAMQTSESYDRIMRGEHGIKTNLSAMLSGNLSPSQMRLLYREDCRTALRNLFICNIRIIQQHWSLFRDNINKEDFYHASNNILQNYCLKLGARELDLHYIVIEELSNDPLFREKAQRNPEYARLIRSLREDNELWKKVVNYLGAGCTLDYIKRSFKNKLIKDKEYTEEQIDQFVARIDEIGGLIQRGVLRELYNNKENLGLRIDHSYGKGWEGDEYAQEQARRNLLSKLSEAREVLYTLGERYVVGINYMNEQDLPERLRSKSLIDICKQLGIDLARDKALEVRSKVWAKAIECSKEGSSYDLRSGKILAEELWHTVDPLQTKELWWQRNMASIAEELAPIGREAIFCTKIIKENREVTISEEQRQILVKVETAINEIVVASGISEIDTRRYSQLEDIGEAYKGVKEKLESLQRHAQFIEPERIADLQRRIALAGRMIEFQELAKQQQYNLERVFQSNSNLLRHCHDFSKELREWFNQPNLPEQARQELTEIQRELGKCQEQLKLIKYISATGLEVDTDPSVASFSTEQHRLTQVDLVNRIAEQVVSKIASLEEHYANWTKQLPLQLLAQLKINNQNKQEAELQQ